MESHVYTPLSGDVVLSCWTRAWRWLWTTHQRQEDVDSVDESEKILRTTRRIEASIRALHLKILKQDHEITRYTTDMNAYAKGEDDERADVEYRQIAEARRVRSIYISIQEKQRVLLQELKKATTLMACTDNLRELSATLGQTIAEHLNVGDVDTMMARLELQMDNLHDTDRSLSRPIKKAPPPPQQRPDDDFVLPELPNVQRVKKDKEKSIVMI